MNNFEPSNEGDAINKKSENATHQAPTPIDGNEPDTSAIDNQDDCENEFEESFYEDTVQSEDDQSYGAHHFSIDEKEENFIFRKDYPYLVGFAETLSIKNFDYQEYCLCTIGDDGFYRDETGYILQPGEILTKPLLKELHLVSTMEEALDRFCVDRVPALFYDHDIEFIESWECPIAEIIYLDLSKKIYTNDILRNFMIRKFKKYCFTLTVSMGSKTYKFGSKKLFMDDLE